VIQAPIDVRGRCGSLTLRRAEILMFEGRCRAHGQVRDSLWGMEIVFGIQVDDEALAAICDRYGIAELQVFGSQVRGAARPDSDIDVLYTLRPGRKLGWEIEQLADELADLFGQKVDLISQSALHPRLKPTVLAEARRLYAA
jgi:uncharacterized protein